MREINYDETLIMLIGHDLKEKARQKALKKGISLSDYIRQLLEADVKEVIHS